MSRKNGTLNYATLDLIGERFGDLMVEGPDERGNGQLICRCSCGRKATIRPFELRQGLRTCCNVAIHRRLDKEEEKGVRRWRTPIEKNRRFCYIIEDPETGETEASFDTLLELGNYLGIAEQGACRVVQRGRCYGSGSTRRRVIRIPMDDDDDE